MLPNEVILNSLISDEDLNKLIQGVTSLKVLNSVLTLKTQRNTGKLNFSLIRIYSQITEDEADLICDTLTKAFLVLENVEEEFEKLINFVNDAVSQEPTKLSFLQILNTITILSSSNEKLQSLLEHTLNTKLVNHFLVNVLRTNSLLKSYILYELFGNYFSILNKNDQRALLDEIFQMTEEIVELDSMCSIYKYDKVKLHFCSKIKFWNFIQKCLQNENNFLESQVVFLLSKSLDFCLNNPEIDKPESLNQSVKIWEDFYTLLGAAKQKQLHLIQPALSLLNTIESLDYCWKLCIYKPLLNHTQISVVYNTILHLFSLDSWLEGDTFIDTLKLLLPAMNKNEYSTHSNQVFNEFQIFCTKLNQEQLQIVLNEILTIAWNPTSCWKIFDSILNGNLIITKNVLSTISAYCLNIPHIYVRKGCLMLLIQCYFNQISNDYIRIIDAFIMLEFYMSDSMICDRIPNKTEFVAFLTKETELNPLYKRILRCFQNTQENNNINSELNDDCDKITLISRKTESAIELYSEMNDFTIIRTEWLNCTLNPTHYDCVFKSFLKSDQQLTENVLETFTSRPLGPSPKEKTNTVISIYKNSIVELMNKKKSLLFKPLLQIYLETIYSVVAQCDDNSFFQLLEEINNILLESSENQCFIGQCLAEIINKHAGNKKMFDISLPVILQLILQNFCTRKDEKVDYFICREISNRFQILAAENPNHIKTKTRLISLESLLIFCENGNSSDQIISVLLHIYNDHFNTRYFPHSKVHIKKLRIIQCLILLEPYLTQKSTLITFIERCFCEEIHQPCVKQLLQFLLIRLINPMIETEIIHEIINKINIANRTQPSTIVAFIPVLFHTMKTRQESYFEEFVDALLPWTMGANFKLRVYSQYAIKKLYDFALKQKNLDFTKKYKHLQQTINNVIETSGKPFFVTLKSDRAFFDAFNAELHNSIETIFIDIPKQNSVCEMEWDNILQHNFKSFIVKTNTDRSYSDITIDWTEDVHSEEKCEDFDNIQRKITPWKEQTTRFHSNFILVGTLIEKQSNLGGLTRTCEVFGVKEFILNDAKIVNNKEFTSLSMSSENWVNIVEVKLSTLQEYLLKMKLDGYTVIGAEQTANSVKLHEFKFPEKTVLLLGNEKLGIPANLIGLLDICVEIPQLGVTRSLNVHVAGATFIWEYTKQHSLTKL